MKNKLELFDSFKKMAETTNAVKSEWERLEGVENRVNEALVKIEEEVAGLRRAEQMSSINYEARIVIERQRKQKEQDVNVLCKFLGISERYKN